MRSMTKAYFSEDKTLRDAMKYLAQSDKVMTQLMSKYGDCQLIKRERKSISYLGNVVYARMIKQVLNAIKIVDDVRQ